MTCELTSPIYLNLIDEVDMNLEKSFFTHLGRLSCIVLLKGDVNTFKGPHWRTDSNDIAKPLWCQLSLTGIWLMYSWICERVHCGDQTKASFIKRSEFAAKSLTIVCTK